MFIDYTISTQMLQDAIKIATDMAKSHGFKTVIVRNAVRTAQTEWKVSLTVGR